MEKREESLREALLKNEEEKERWEKYKKENETAIENLKEFSKHLTVDVMVPVGRKCFMPGKLIHTNEVLVGHYQGYFSKCTAFKAKEICDLRINKAKDQLKKLETEAELWTNKLKIPHMEGVVPNAAEREIIEDYNEEREKLWREEHKKNVRKAKLKEKQQRDEIQRLEKQTETEAKQEKTDDEIFKILEEAELMEELENELDSLEIEEINDETLKKLMTGEVESTKPKQRIAHDVNQATSKPNSKTPALDGVVKKNAEEFEITKPPATNNNNRPNPELLDNSNEDVEADMDSNDLPQEVQIIKEQAQFLQPNDRIGFYEYQVEIVRKKLKNLKMNNEEDIEEKLHLLVVLEELEDLLALAEELSPDTDYESEFTDDEKVDMLKAEKAEELEAASTEKKRIHFALENDTLVFRREERVSQMLPKSMKKQKQRKRDIIKLNDDGDVDELNVPNAKQKPDHQSADTATNVLVDKKEEILEKVEKNLEFVSNNQSQIDCDLVSKIIDETQPMSRTIYIAFKHSNQVPSTADTPFQMIGEDSKEEVVPGKPSDFYELYLKQMHEYNMAKVETPKSVYVNSYIGEEEVKAPILKESNRQALYEDPRLQYSLPKSNRIDSENEIKPILRNKSAVAKEVHHTASENSKKSKINKKRNNLNEEEIMSAYNKVMNDVVEKPLIEPEPLPEGKFIDAHAPKKRVSRFKQARAVEKT